MAEKKWRNKNMCAELITLSQVKEKGLKNESLTF